MNPAKHQKGVAHIPIVLVIVLVAVGGIAIGRSSLLDRIKVDNPFKDEAITTVEEQKVDELDIDKKEKEEVPEIEIKKEPEKVKEEEEVEEEEQVEEPLKKGITLTSDSQDKGVHLYWSVNGISVSNGYKIVKSTDSNPTFPDDGYVYVSDSGIKNYFLGLKDGKTWHIRVCRYNGSGGCDYYSNEIVFKAPDLDGDKSDDDGNVDEIYLKVTKKSDDKVKLEWSVDGKAKSGFKVLWSRNDKPTYPLGDGDKYHYLNDSGARSDYVDDLDDNKKYYFRVCEYLGGKCGTYSNQVSIEL